MGPQGIVGRGTRAARSDLGFAPARLPGELVYLYLVAPIVASPLLVSGFLELTPRAMASRVAGNYVLFATIPLAIHALYASVVPKLVVRVRNLGARLALHAAMMAVVTVVVAFAVRPLHVRLSGHTPPLGRFLVSSILVTWTFLLPTLIILELRARAEVADAAERQLLEEQKTALRAQLEAIQARTNPHFLFNALNTIASLIRDDPALAEQTLERLADILRYALKAAGEVVPVSREIAIIEDYLEVQKARFGARLRYTIAVEPGAEKLTLPPFLLQPLVENAVLHGIAGRPEGGEIALAVRRRGTRIEVRVEDDGAGPQASPHEGSGVGLHDLRRRLGLLYGDDFSVVAREGETRGFVVELSVPARGEAP